MSDLGRTDNPNTTPTKDYKKASGGVPLHEVTQGEPRTNHHTRDSERKGRIGLNCLSVNPKRARMGSLLVLDCTLYILEYMWAVRGYP